MKGVYIGSVTVVVVLLFLYQWPKMKSNDRKEKAAFATIAMIGWAAAVVYIIFPEMTSPAKVLDFILVQVRNFIFGPI
ncbi:hypothetical protein J40TS1_35890 [Paenibacillus montaniterrae]|uniref:Uncharacterized protein n=1 Tax=Paenibacillus montaniterrae TaxID=429341 RepID=A0A920CVB7_9BACL|nr:hypothetical protein [Paenibacillus montaniterrae]GIP17947.1 hypothetical protein J40TS1_35890 [Paenibacillus montaniterrae]